MRWKVTLIILLILGGVAWWFAPTGPSEPAAPAAYTGRDIAPSGGATTTPPVDVLETAPRAEVIAENLSIPWEVLFLPDGELLVTERPGRVLLLKSGVELLVEGIRSIGEGGLLGAALHPDFSENNYLYLYQTTEDGAGLQNRVVRYVFANDTLTLDRVIIDDLPGARYHDGGRIAFGPDGHLYVTVGDALSASEAANPNSLNGTILRLTDEGEPVPSNPFDTAVYSYGHRNAQGLTWDEAGNLWSSEHGRSVGASGFDEINFIVAGGNYGWPESQGNSIAPGTIPPVRHSTADVTWAPGDLQYHDGSLFMPGLRGATLYEAELRGKLIVDWEEHFVGEYGRLRTVRVGPDGFLYLLTSNRDGRGDEPAANDDRIIRINPTKL